MIRAWCKEDEIYDNDVCKDRKQQGAALQFFGAFRYNYKGPCHVYYHETMEDIEAGEKSLEWENKVSTMFTQMKSHQNESRLNAEAAMEYTKDRSQYSKPITIHGRATTFIRYPLELRRQ